MYRNHLHAAWNRAVPALVLALLACPPVAAQIPGTGYGQTELLQRIYRGDWVWSLEFPRADAALLGYGMGLLRGTRSACPQYRADKEEELFTTSWIMAGVMGNGVPGPDLGAMITGVAAARSARPAGEADGARVASVGGCEAPAVRRTVENASRMVSGRRPAHGGEHQGSTLVKEEVARVRTRQITDRASSAFLRNPRLFGLFEQHANELSRLGFQVLECHYDSDPSDGDYEVQYYWATGVASVAQTTTMLPRLVAAAQARIERAATGMARHPFLDYGPPRSECPARLDPRMAHKEIYAPRNAGPVAEAPAVAGAPTIEDNGSYRSYTYGAVPESFNPPLPDLPSGKTMVIQMAKQQMGSLARVSLTRNWPPEVRFWPAAREIDRERRRGNPARSRILAEDIRAADGAIMLKCGYLAEERGMLDVRFYWYQEQPEHTDADRLQSRLSNHPLLNIRSARDDCPLDPEP